MIGRDGQLVVMRDVPDCDPARAAGKTPRRKRRCRGVCTGEGSGLLCERVLPTDVAPPRLLGYRGQGVVQSSAPCHVHAVT
ncbi:MAG: hypothetical protein J7M39_09125, partial [Anaerolineae bacterium]|nr:hypothetical protein [Anaerolineae bacterium]